ncbi:hypothetical protein M501DRAFT_850530 [Patellaria atrata CBS 101060]|uniref:Uncharacterized protein n=1 Tax=Patellaria atrata CBS 101060 TaxID=1346257 RepID=A0A9P4SAJ0_9PEZI|nr:hypothetical protein M501DRAFT_850530 [Patellaria atrata CBS 101060]
MSTQQKLPLESSSLPSTIPPTHPLPPNLHTSLLSALLTAHSIPAIQSALLTSLSQTGWTTNIRAYILELLRSGECGSYNELMAKVLEEAVGKQSEDMNGKEGRVNGVGNGEAEGETGIRIPEKAVQAGIKAVRQELEKVCDVTFGDE